MSLRFLGQDIGRQLKILNAGMMELADVTTQNPVVATPCGFDPRFRHQTLTARKPLIYRGLRAFSFCRRVGNLACHGDFFQYPSDFWGDFGGTFSTMRRDIHLKLRWQTQPLRWNSSAYKCLRWSKYRCDLTTPEFLSGWHRLHIKGLRSYAVTV